MRTMLVRTGLSLVLLLAGLRAGAGAACTTDADCDNGDTCSVADVCSSGTCVVGGGGDTDAPPGTRDFVCDDEVDPDLQFVANKLVLRKRTAPTSDNSSVRGKGSVLVTPSSPMGAFTDDGGFSVRIKDTLSQIAPPGDGIDVRFTWDASGCNTDGPTITCVSPNGKSFIRFKQNPFAPNQWNVKFKMKGLNNLTGPFFGPVRVVFSRGADRHQGVLITDCKLTTPGLKCREF